MSAYVYLLKHLVAHRVKIGKALDVPDRARGLGGWRFDLTQSTALRVADEAAAHNLEELLHRAVFTFRIAPEDLVRMPGESTQGDTEWFDIACMDSLTQFISSNKTFLGCELVESRELQGMFADPKRKRSSVVRDTFSMPQGDFELIDKLMDTAARAGHRYNKSEMVRGGLHALNFLSAEALLVALSRVERIAPGRKGQA
jgi:hypothetical protein